MNRLMLNRSVLDYQELFKAFESLLKGRTRFFVADDSLATALFELLATMGAHEVIKHVCASTEFEISSIRDENEGLLATNEPFPTYTVVETSGQRLLAAAASDDKIAVLAALRTMGVLVLCPIPENPFPRLELIGMPGAFCIS
jgi:hypothetical protein